MARETFERDETGRYLEEFEVGEIIHHWPGRTITEWENIQFTLLTGNPTSFHLDVEAATSAGHPGMLVNGGLLVALVHGLSTRELSAGTAKSVFFIGMTDVRIVKSCYTGDTIRVHSEVLDTRPSRSKPDRGILTVRTWAENQHGQLVIEFTRAIMLWRKGHGPQQ